MKKLFTKYREIIMYLIFGVLTTAVSWGVYFLLMSVGRGIIGIEPGDVESARYIALYTAAQVISWVCAVLFSFFTNRAWVFTDADKSVSVPKQLAAFASGRLLTLGLDYVITYAGALLILRVVDGSENYAETVSKMAAAVVVMAGNYVFGKLFVFRKKKGRDA